MKWNIKIIRPLYSQLLFDTLYLFKSVAFEKKGFKEETWSKNTHIEKRNTAPKMAEVVPEESNIQSEAPKDAVGEDAGLMELEMGDDDLDDFGPACEFMR